MKCTTKIEQISTVDIHGLIVSTLVHMGQYVAGQCTAVHCNGLTVLFGIVCSHAIFSRIGCLPCFMARVSVNSGRPRKAMISHQHTPAHHTSGLYSSWRWCMCGLVTATCPAWQHTLRACTSSQQWSSAPSGDLQEH